MTNIKCLQFVQNFDNLGLFLTVIFNDFLSFFVYSGEKVKVKIPFVLVEFRCSCAFVEDNKIKKVTLIEICCWLRKILNFFYEKMDLG